MIEMDCQAHAMIAAAAMLRAQVAAKQVEIQAMRLTARPAGERLEGQLPKARPAVIAPDALGLQIVSNV